jgi:hypothetical protein
MAIKFCQIIDARFVPGSEDELKASLTQRIMAIGEKLKSLGVLFCYGSPRFLNWKHGASREFQWRIDCVAIKPRALPWDSVYEAINCIKAVPYDKISDAHAANLVVGMQQT